MKYAQSICLLLAILPSTAMAQCGIYPKAFVDCYQSGNWECLYEGQTISKYDNDISSLMVPRGFKVTAYDRQDCTGTPNYDWTGDDSCIGSPMRDKISCFIVTTTPTSPPTSPPTIPPTNPPTNPHTNPPIGAHGDPHMVMWSGEKYDFHGICDLVLLSDPGFGGNEGLDIHIRTHKLREWSYVEASTIRIGSDVLEVTGGEDNMNNVMMNGHIHEFKNTDNGVEEMLAISGYPISFKKISKKAQEFVVDLGPDEAIIFRTWNSFVSIEVQNPSGEKFGSSVGLMGSFSSGKKVARDNKTILDDVNEFGQEWQVNGDEPKLFQEAKEPQFPKKCEIPSAVEMRRRLEASKMTVEEAEIACAKVGTSVKELCMFDVMATGDESVSGAY